MPIPRVTDSCILLNLGSNPCYSLFIPENIWNSCVDSLLHVASCHGAREQTEMVLVTCVGYGRILTSLFFLVDREVFPTVPAPLFLLVVGATCFFRPSLPHFFRPSFRPSSSAACPERHSSCMGWFHHRSTISSQQQKVSPAIDNVESAVDLDTDWFGDHGYRGHNCEANGAENVFNIDSSHFTRTRTFMPDV